MKLSSFYRGKHTFPIIIFLITITCCIVTIPTYFDTKLFDLLAWWSQPKYFWQVLSGTFEHGIIPHWFLWVHFSMNMLMVLPLGLIVERFLKTKGTCILFLASWILPSIIYQIALHDVHGAGAGVSAVGYSFGPIAFYLIVKFIKTNKNKVFRQGLTYLFLFDLIGMLFMLYPVITGWLSFALHMSGIIIGIVVLLIFKKQIDHNFNLFLEGNETKETIAVPYYALFIIPVFFVIVIILYYCNVIAI